MVQISLKQNEKQEKYISTYCDTTNQTTIVETL